MWKRDVACCQSHARGWAFHQVLNADVIMIVCERVVQILVCCLQVYVCVGIHLLVLSGALHVLPSMLEIRV